MNEYAYKQKACIRNKQPTCDSTAVIPSITVETVDGITNLANCLVHVTSTNTTYYVDDKHRIMITWAGPVNIPGYDMEGNPEGFKDQIVTDTEAGIAVIYDKNGIGYTFGIQEGLDVQEEINNKIDDMVEDGTLDTIINDEIFGEIQEEIAKNKKYESKVTMICDHGNQGDCYVVQFANGKNMFIDTGMESAWSHIYLTITNMGITKFDYGIITHPHGDHAGNVQNFIDNFDVSECTWYIGKVPDLTQIENERTRYENFLTLLQTNDITPIQPTNNSTVTIDELSKTSMRFLNTDPEWFDDYYYPNAIGEYNTDKQTANVFSLVTEITFDNVKFLSVGDIEKCVEDKLVYYIGKVDICTAPHHFDNKHGNKQFWDNISPDTIFLNSPNGSDAYGNYDYQLATQANRYIINSYFTTADTVTATTYGYNFEYDTGTCKYLEYPHVYNNIGSLISSVQVSGGYSGITLNTILDSMETGDVLITSALSGYTALLSDLSSIFMITVPSGSTLKITKHYENQYEIVITEYAKRLTFEANKFGDNYYVKGYGVAGSWGNETELLALINSVTAGTYEVQYNGNADHALGSLAGYMTLHITNITSSGYRKGYLEGVRNNTNFTIWFGNFTGVAGGFAWKVFNPS